VCLNLNTRELSFWINGKHNKKNKNKQLKTPGLAWRPYIRFMEENYVAILKPFCHFTNGPKQSKSVASLPDFSMSSNYIQVSYLADLIRNYLFVYTSQTVDAATLKTNLKHHGEVEPEIMVPSLEAGSNNGSVALLRFKTQLDANLYAQHMITVHTEYSILDAWNIAKLLHSKYETSPSFPLGFDKLAAAQMQQIRSVFSKFLTSNLFSADQLVSLNTMVGLSEEKPHNFGTKTAMQDVLASLETLVKQ
jgi:hypothetical protein